MREESVRILLSLICQKRKQNEKLIWNLEEKMRIVQAMANTVGGIENIDIVETEKDLMALRQEEMALSIAEKELLERI